MGSKIEWMSNDKVKIVGTLDEFFDYDSFFAQLKTHAEVTIDVSGIHRINSCGVRDWMRHIINLETRLTFVNCTPAFVDQASMIPQFVGDNNEIVSFYGTYVCDECAEELDVLYKIGENIEPGNECYDEPEPRKCTNCGNAMHFAHNHALYFSFLQRPKAS